MDTYNVLNNFKDYVTAKSVLEEAIKCSILLDIDINLEDKYSFDGSNLMWNFDEDCYMYSEESRLIKEFNDCEMYKVYSCTGDKYILVFDKSNKLETNDD